MENQHFEASPVPQRKLQKETATPMMPENIPLVAASEQNVLPLDDHQTVSPPEVDDRILEIFGTNQDDHPEVLEDGDIPIILSRAGGDGESDNPDGPPKPEAHPKGFPGRLSPFSPNFGIGIDLEAASHAGSNIGDLESIPDVNVYQHKKTLAQGMMDLALFSANANQLRYVLESSGQHPYFYPSLVLISFSLICQVAVGIGLTWNALYNVKDDKQICIANKINNFTIIGIFLVTVINVFICSFGVAGGPAVAVAAVVAPAVAAPTT